MGVAQLGQILSPHGVVPEIPAVYEDAPEVELEEIEERRETQDA
jgi:hypothetical protein